MPRSPLSGFDADPSVGAEEPSGPFDYTEPADLYFPVQVGRKAGLDYRRFPSATLALRYAMESLLPGKLNSATLEVDGERYDSVAMRRLYASSDFPAS
ncbi:hypothetical protein [Devosia sp. Root105]|uniref:hypothetical protein n=1 Tax=Devosia sp. Root105 TaxID=1736423 RepID=UPI000701E85A|nr:hypothetical protein [Devosia sp. Root105]KQU98911.1 hypothetical protein ASC68_05810 [Devosia sp. Root105]